MSRRPRPIKPPSRVVPAVLSLMIALVGFATLMVRLEALREGYRISALRVENAQLENDNRALWLSEAQLSSHERLRELAPKYNLAPPTRGQVVMIP
jgi:cell division protein FtsL